MKIGNYKLKIVLVTLLLFLWSNEASAAFRISRPPYLLGLTSGLVGHWTFDGPNMLTNVRDSSGQGNNGSLIGQAATTTVPGKVGQALQFDGTDDYVNVGTGLNSSLTVNDAFSLAFWLRSTGSSEISVIANADLDSPYVGMEVLIEADGDIRLDINSDGDNLDRITVTAGLHDSRWHYVVIAHADSTASNTNVYIDGVLKSKTVNSDSGADLNSSTNLQIGARDGANRLFNGSLDDVRIYNRALTQAEITALYTATKGEKVSTTNTSSTANGNALSNGLVGHWTFDGKDTPWTSSSAATTLDKSGNGNTGTLTSMSQSLSPVAGKLGQALKFDGSDDYVVSASNIGISGAASRTVSFWAKNDSGGQGAMVSLGVASGNTMFAAVCYTGVWYLNIFGANDYSTGNACDTKWHHHLITYDGVTSHWFKDAIEIGSGATHTLNTTNAVVKIGDRPDGGWKFNGLIDDVRIYIRALSQAEITALYTATKGQKVSTTNTNSVANGNPLASGLVGHWTFDGNKMLTNVGDSSGQGNNGSLIGQAATTTVPGKVGQALSFDGTDDYVE